MSARYTDSDHALILGGVFQAARLTYELARYGRTDERALEASIDTLFRTRPDSVLAVYGEVENIALGLRHFIAQLDRPQERNVEVTQYSIRLLQLGRKLYTDRKTITGLGEDLDSFQSRMDVFSFENSTRYTQLAKIYQERISPLSSQIMVKGDPLHLQNSDTASRIRCALLAGVRSAHLWYQCGGKRWHLLTRRKRLLDAALSLLEVVKSPESR